MKIIEKYSDYFLKQDSQPMIHVNHSAVDTNTIAYVKKLILPGPTVALFSNGWQLTLDATYIEQDYLKDMKESFHDNTFFVDEKNFKLISDTLQSLNCCNLMVVHPVRFKYQSIANINNTINEYMQLMPEVSQIIAVISMTFINFNRLTTSVRDLEHQLLGTLIGADIITRRIKNDSHTN